VVLQQAKDVVVRSAKNLQLTEPVDDETYFVRVPVAGDHGRAWMDTWLAPAREEKPTVPAPPLNEVRLERICQARYPQQGEWEVDFFMISNAVREKAERPQFPYTLLCMDRQTSLMLMSQLALPAQYRQEFPEHIFTVIAQQKTIPKIIYVCRREAKELLKPIAERLHITLKTTRVLPLVQYGKAALLGHLERY
jgi:hypothetical protein